MKNSTFTKKKNSLTLQSSLEKEKVRLKSKEASEICSTRRIPRKWVPHAKAYARVMERLKDHRFAHPRQAAGKEPLSVEAVERVKIIFIEVIFEKLSTDWTSVWERCGYNLEWKAFKQHKVQVLSPANKLARKSACEFRLTFPESWFERVIWTDVKWFVLRSPPHL